jgi:hypothetical protein
MARRCVRGVRVDVKTYARRYAVDAQRMGIEFAFQRTENTKVRKKQVEMLKTYVGIVIGRAWIGIPAPVASTSCSIRLEYKYLDSMRIYKPVAYIKLTVLG